MIQHHAISEHTAYGTPFITVDWSKKPRIEDVLSALETAAARVPASPEGPSVYAVGNLAVTPDDGPDILALCRAAEQQVNIWLVICADSDVILVGGGSIILPEKIAGAAQVVKPRHFGCANAIGSAISKVSGTFEKLINYDEIPRDKALEQAKAEAVDLAVAAGAIRDTVEIIEVEDVPLAYYAGNTNRVKIKAAGDLAN